MTTTDAPSIWLQTLADVRDTAASDRPTPGGGSITAVAATLGLSLVLMALAITLKKTPDDPALAQLDQEGRELLDRLTPHADRDIALFSQFMDALALPRDTPAQKDARQRARQQALLDATHGPLDAATDVARALGLARRALPLASRHVRSDVLAGADLLHGALRGVLRNVDINLPGIRDEATRASLQQRADALLAEGDACYRDVTPTGVER